MKHSIIEAARALVASNYTPDMLAPIRRFDEAVMERDLDTAVEIFEEMGGLEFMESVLAEQGTAIGMAGGPSRPPVPYDPWAPILPKVTPAFIRNLEQGTDPDDPYIDQGGDTGWHGWDDMMRKYWRVQRDVNAAERSIWGIGDSVESGDDMMEAPGDLSWGDWVPPGTEEPPKKKPKRYFVGHDHNGKPVWTTDLAGDVEEQAGSAPSSDLPTLKREIAKSAKAIMSVSSMKDDPGAFVWLLDAVDSLRHHAPEWKKRDLGPKLHKAMKAGGPRLKALLREIVGLVNESVEEGSLDGESVEEQTATGMAGGSKLAYMGSPTHAPHRDDVDPVSGLTTRYIPWDPNGPPNTLDRYVHYPPVPNDPNDPWGGAGWSPVDPPPPPPKRPNTDWFGSPIGNSGNSGTHTPPLPPTRQDDSIEERERFEWE